MLFGTAGPLVVAWLSRRLPDVLALRANTPIVITMSACAVLLTMGAAGRLSHAELWWRWLMLIVLAALGVLLGHHWARRVSAASLRKLICGLLVISGLSLVAHAAAGLGRRLLIRRDPGRHLAAPGPHDQPVILPGEAGADRLLQGVCIGLTTAEQGEQQHPGQSHARLRCQPSNARARVQLK